MDTSSRRIATHRVQWVISALVGCLISSAALADSANTLDKLRKTRVLTVGVRDNNLPFSTLSQGMATGYSIDLCNKVLDAARKELKLPDLKVQYVPVTANDRIEKLKSGVIDLECGLTVNAKSRQADVNFSYSHFVAGEKLLTRKDSGIADYDNLPGKTVGVVKATTAEKLISQLREVQYKTMKVEIFNSNQEALKALDNGKIQAFAQLDVVLESQRLQSSNPNVLVLTPKPMSVEPMALMVRKSDDGFRALVDKTLAGLYSGGEINAIYDRWFNTGALRIPMSKMLRESISRPSKEPAVALGLGYTL